MGRGYYLKSGFREMSRTQIELDFFLIIYFPQFEFLKVGVKDYFEC